jgi:uncharacterized membrane protein
MIINTTLTMHIIAGTVCLVTGYVALFTRKGKARHRKYGNIFVAAALFTASSAILIAVLKPEKLISVVGGLTSLYLVLSGLRAATTRQSGLHRTDLILLIVPVATGALALGLAITAYYSTDRKLQGLPFGAYLFWALVSFVSIGADISYILRTKIKVSTRICRHLWRMCFGLFLAEAALILGQRHVLPAALQSPAYIATPLVVVLATMIFWIVKIRLSASTMIRV